MKITISFCRRILVCLSITILLLGSRSIRAVLADDLIQTSVQRILRHQTSDGALAMSVVSSSPSDVVPYFSNLSAIGLMNAYRKTHEAALRDAVRHWIDWYEAHLNADGTIFDYHGTPGNWKSTGTYDSVDSYAATYLELVWDVYRSDNDRVWLNARRATVNRVVKVIRSVLQPIGLTIARPTYPVMYTMDNVETLRGLRSAAKIANTFGDHNLAAMADSSATAMEKAISIELWDSVHLCYRVDIQTDGGKEEGLGKWYPNVMANLMAIAWLPPSSRNRALLARLNERFGSDLPTSIRTEDDLEHVVWRALASRGAGNTMLLEKDKRLLDVSVPAIVRLDDLAMLGHICRL